jgi:hypothetical protein
MRRFLNSFSDWLYKANRQMDSEFIGTVCVDDCELNQHLIEPRIRSLVLMMNRSGYCKTLASCQGHLCRFPWSCMSSDKPYIYFKANQEVYAAIFSRLRFFGAKTKLEHGFASLGLEMHPRESVCMFIDLDYGNRWITRKQVDEDIASLLEILERDVFQVLANRRRQDVVEGN